MRRGELRVSARQWHDKVHCTKGHMANSMLQPCGLGCHMLGACRTTCLGHKPHPQPPALARSHRAQHLDHAGQVRITAQNPLAIYCISYLPQHIPYTLV